MNLGRWIREWASVDHQHEQTKENQGEDSANRRMDSEGKKEGVEKSELTTKTSEEEREEWKLNIFSRENPGEGGAEPN